MTCPDCEQAERQARELPEQIAQRLLAEPAAIKARTGVDPLPVVTLAFDKAARIARALSGVSGPTAEGTDDE